MARAAPQAHTVRAMQSVNKAEDKQDFVGPEAYASATAFRKEWEEKGCWVRQSARRNRAMQMVVSVQAFRRVSV